MSDLPAEVKTVTALRNTFADGDNFDTVMRGAMALSKSTLVPQNYQHKPENCFIAINLANRMGVDPMVVMQSLYVVQGKPSWAGQACMMLIRNSGLFSNAVHVYTGEKNTDTWGCYVEATRISTGETVKGAEVTISIAKREGWHNKTGSKWQTMPEIMLAYRAAAWFARVHCPEAMLGMSTTDEAQDVHAPRAIEDVLK